MLPNCYIPIRTILNFLKKGVRLIIDPYTQTLGYSAFTTKSTYKKIPYLVSALKKETPKDFANITALQQRVKKGD